MNIFFVGVSYLILSELIVLIFGNGRLLVPPQRSSLWRDPKFYRFRYVYRNYNDHTLNCGGFWRMHENKGKCGVCGDPWDAEKPRPNEAGGIYARGIIGRTYSIDKRFIDAVIQVTSSISGYFEFNICPNDNIRRRVSRECLDNFPMRILSKDRTTSYGRRYIPDIPAGQPGVVELSLEIPEDLECTQCVLQWRWHGANNYGMCRNGRWGKGCGDQPEIYNCADIAILPDHMIKYEDKERPVPVVPRPRPIIPSPTSRPTTSPPTTQESVVKSSTTMKQKSTTTTTSESPPTIAFKSLPTTTFKSMPTTTFKSLPTTTFKSLPTTTFKSLPTTTFNSLTTTTFKSLPTTTFKSLPTTTSESLPTTTFKSLPTTTFKSLPTTTFKSLPTTTFKSLPTTTSESLQTTTFKLLPTTTSESLPTASLESLPTTTSESLPTASLESLQTTTPESLPTTTSESLPINTTESLSTTTLQSMPTTTSESLPTTRLKPQQSTTTESLPTTISESLPTTTAESLPTTSASIPNSESLQTTITETQTSTTAEALPKTTVKLVSTTKFKFVSTTNAESLPTATSDMQDNSTSLTSFETEMTSTPATSRSTNSFQTSYPITDSGVLTYTISTDLSASPPTSSFQDFTSSTLANKSVATNKGQHTTVSTVSSNEEQKYSTNFIQNPSTTSTPQSYREGIVSNDVPYINNTYSTPEIGVTRTDVSVPLMVLNSTASTNDQSTLLTSNTETDTSTVGDNLTIAYQDSSVIKTVKPTSETSLNSSDNEEATGQIPISESVSEPGTSRKPSTEYVTEHTESTTEATTIDYQKKNEHSIKSTTSTEYGVPLSDVKENATQSLISGSSIMDTSKRATTVSFLQNIDGVHDHGHITSNIIDNDIYSSVTASSMDSLITKADTTISTGINIVTTQKYSTIKNSSISDKRINASNSITEENRRGQMNGTVAEIKIDFKGVTKDVNIDGSVKELTPTTVTDMPPIAIKVSIDNITDVKTEIPFKQTEDKTESGNNQNDGSKNQTFVNETNKANTTPSSKTNSDIELLGLLNAMIAFESRTDRANALSSSLTNEVNIPNEIEANKVSDDSKRKNMDQNVSPTTTSSTLSFELFSNTSPATRKFSGVTQSLFRPINRGVTSRSTIFRGKLGGRLGNGISVATLFPISRLMDIDLNARN